MGVMILEDCQDSHPLWDELKEKTCFLCQGDLFDDLEHSTGGVVYWIGADGLIALHQSCAEHLGLNLIQDARSLVRKTGKITRLLHDLPSDAGSSWYVSG